MATARAQQRVKQEDLEVEEFAVSNGMETREERDAIPAGSYSWLMNFQPIGQRTLRVLNGKGATLYTAPGGTTILWYSSVIIASTYYLIVFLANGKADQVKISDGTVTHISTVANTFWSGTGEFPHFTAVGNSGILIISPLGYWAWDGSTLYKAGDQAPVWVSGLAAQISATGNTHTNTTLDTLSTTAGVVVGMTVSGSGIPVGTNVASIDSPTQVTLSQAATATASGVSITFSAVITTTGNTHSNTTLDTLGTTVGVVVGMGVIGTGIPTGTTVTAITSSTAVTLSQPATATASGVTITFNWLMPSGVVGTAIEIYNATPWIVNGRTIIAAAPGNGATFATSQGGVSLPVKDAYVQDGYSGLKALDGFLYLFAHGAVDVISDVSTSGTPPTTTFLRIPVSTSVGTPWRDSINSTPNSLVCANTTGVFEVRGGSLTKVSSPMDGIFETCTFPVASSDPSGYHPTSSMTTLNTVPCYTLTLFVDDPDTGDTIHALAMWDGRRWFLTTQETQPTICARQDSDSVFTCWGSDATTIYQCFAAASDTLEKKAKTWFAATRAGISWRKRLMRLWMQFGNSPAGAPFSSLDIDTESGSFPIDVPQPGIVTWVNNSGGVVQWVNNSNQPIYWTTDFYPLVLGEDVEIVALVFALTYATTNKTLDVIGFVLGYTLYSRYA